MFPRAFITRNLTLPLMGRLDGRAALVTGGSGGIGRVTALELAREGADVAVQYLRGREGAEETVRRVRELGRKGVALPADVSSPKACKALARETVDVLSRLDVAVCLAGYPLLPEVWYKDFADLEPDEIRRPLEVDLLGSFYVSQAVLPIMATAGMGSLVLVGSTPAITGDVVGIPYLVAKAGILGLTRALAQTYGPRGVRVNAVALGSIETEGTTGPTKSEDRKTLATEPALKRWGRPDEVARAIAFLASDDSSYVTGQTLIIDGGYALR